MAFRIYKYNLRTNYFMPQYIRHKSQCREIPEELLLSQWNHHITCSGRLRIRSQWTNAIVKGTLLTNGFLANFVTGGKHQINILLLFSQSHSENGPLRYIYVTNCDCKSESETFIWCLPSMLSGTSEKWLGYAFETRRHRFLIRNRTGWTYLVSGARRSPK